MQHNGIQVTFATRIDLHGNSSARRSGAVSIDGCGNIAIHDGHAQFFGQARPSG